MSLVSERTSVSLHARVEWNNRGYFALQAALVRSTEFRLIRVKISSSLASDFVVLVLSEAVLSETVLVLDGCSNFGDFDR
jgi:hypothetical protein